ncbi:hypothetical protein D779_4018 [Imhoffiella purpurea]|uniref:Uncharacterized protein n=1 Tax=Imhoffiella purpurea TaxID=1249627 RepID=W9VQC1_9GAMM|nr:hypothetical protein D779_4018 [Imhoffiella purpurea]
MLTLLLVEHVGRNSTAYCAERQPVPYAAGFFRPPFFACSAPLRQPRQRSANRMRSYGAIRYRYCALRRARRDKQHVGRNSTAYCAERQPAPYAAGFFQPPFLAFSAPLRQPSQRSASRMRSCGAIRYRYCALRRPRGRRQPC